jgi:peptidoglycan hydrolase-like protein with peptidoglycan-binding domain/TPR repeat protein
MEVIRSELFTSKRRYRAWWTLAISTLALAFPATAMGAGRGSGHPTLQVNPAVGASARHAAADGPGGTLLALGSGYGRHGGSPLVRTVQRSLDTAGYSVGRVDGLYGPRTRRAVVAFQSAHGLKVDGVVGPRTWAALNSHVPVLGPGAGSQPGGSNAVRALQRGLVSAGDSPGRIDGVYGVLTERAVRRFQRARGLPPSGRADPRTFALLEAPTGSVRRSKPDATHPAASVPPPSVSPPAPGSPPRVRPAASHRTRGGAPWMTILGALALALALILAGPLLIAALRLKRRRDSDETAVATMSSSQAAESGMAMPTLLATANGTSGARTNGAPTNGTPARSNGHFVPSAEAAGAFDLGLLLEAQGDLIDARAAYARADERGHGTAAARLGRLLEEEGALSEAEAAYRRADQRGDPDGAFNLGVLLEERDVLGDAAAAYRRAADRGHDAAASNLGVLLEEQGALSEAEAAYRRADEHGDATAAFNLGVLLEERGEWTDAMEAYQRAEERDEGDVANMARTALLDLEREGPGARVGPPAEAQNA